MYIPNLQQWALSLSQLISYSSEDRGKIFNLGGKASPWLAVTPSSSCCDALATALTRESVFFPRDAAYSFSLDSFFSLRARDLKPSCVVLPKSAQEVSLAVRTLSLGANVWKDSCQFSIRGGGHTPYGAANIDHGIVLDLVHMPSSGLSPDFETITVSPSTTWDAVYETLDSVNRSALGTKVAGVGVGGAATGCGVSYFSPRYGFICDMIENFEVVLATGDIINANAKEHPRLWKALRGGTNNFGVVTALTIKTFEQGAFWGGQVFHTLETRNQHFKSLTDLAHVITTVAFTNMTQTWFVANSLQYTKSDPPELEPEAFKSFLEVPQVAPFPGAPPNTLRVDTVTGFAREYASLSFYPKRWTFATLSFAPDQDMLEVFFQLANRTMKPFFGLPGFQIAINYQILPTVQSERYGAIDSLGPIQTQGNLIFIHRAMAVDQSESDHDSALKEALQDLFKQAIQEARARHVDRSYLQPTYAEAWQNPLSTRSRSTIDEMIETSKLYDPLRIFQQQVPGGFKLPEL